MNLTLVGTSRCDVPAREAAGGIIAPLRAARTAQRAVPTRFRVQSAIISWNSSHEPGGARLRRALTDSCGWEIRARRSLAPPFMVQMRGGKTVETFHEPQKVAQASCLFGADRLEACPTLQPAPRFMAPTHVQFLEVFPFHEPQPSSSCSSSSSSSTGRLGFEDEDDDEDEPVHGANARRKSRGRSPARRERVEGQLSSNWRG